MAKRYSKEWRENVSRGVKKSLGPITDERRKLLSEWGKRGNLNRVYIKKHYSKQKWGPNSRAKVLAERGEKCEKCGWEEKNPYYNKIPVQVNHKNGDREDNRPENLEVLCPNCHALSEHHMFYGRSHKGTWGKKGTKRYR